MRDITIMLERLIDGNSMQWISVWRITRSSPRTTAAAFLNQDSFFSYSIFPLALRNAKVGFHLEKSATRLSFKELIFEKDCRRTTDETKPGIPADDKTAPEIALSPNGRLMLVGSPVDERKTIFMKQL